MKTNVKHLLDRPPLSPEEINSMQDFDAVLKGRGAPLKGGKGGGGKGGWMIGGGLIIVSAVAFFWLVSPLGDKEAKSGQVEQKIPETMPRKQEGSEDIVGAPLVPPVSQATRPVTENTVAAQVAPRQEAIFGNGDEPTDPHYLALKEEIAQLEKNKPRAPRKANKYRPHLDLKIDSADYPELAGFIKMQFEVAPEDKSFTEDYYKIVWNDIQLKRHSGDRYKMVLTRNEGPNGTKQVVELIVIPVISEADFVIAEKEYAKRLKEYERQLAEKKEEARRFSR